MSSTTAADRARRTHTRRTLSRGARRTAVAVAFWLAVWQVVASVVDQGLLVAPPSAVLVRLAELLPTADFWATVTHSLVRIGLGFLLAAAAGVLTAVAAAAVHAVDTLVTPLLAAVRAAPVVSFIILVLLWAPSDRIAAVVSFLMVVPIVHTTVLEGLRHRDGTLLEMAAVFEVPLRRRIAAVDVPAVLPFFLAACRTGVGLAWKSGIAAEVIGLPQGSIGERLYDAKLFLSTADLVAWTLVVIALSFLAEGLVVLAVRRLAPGLPRDAADAGGLA